MIWIAVEINCYRGRTTTVYSIYFKSAREGMEWFDKKHDCHPQKNLCDYCNKKNKWENKGYMFEKFVDHDGAGVFYQVKRLKHSPKE